MKSFRDRVAVVTGAASGIGFALAERFAGERMKVVVADVDETALAAAAERLRAAGATIVAVRADVSRAEEVEALAARAYSDLGAVHVLCNNAGVGGGGVSWELGRGDWEWVLGVNLWGVIHGVRAFVPRMLAGGDEGHVVNTASVAGLLTSPGMGPYCVSKFGVVALSETMHQELAMQGGKVRVSVLCPGWVNTRISDSERNRPAALGPQREPTEQEKVILDAVRGFVAAGLPPARVADLVVEAIREERLYILTHPDFAPLIRQRMEGVLA